MGWSAPVASGLWGLVPKKAVEMAADYFRSWRTFHPSQVFENQLAAARSGASLTETRTGLCRGFGEALLWNRGRSRMERQAAESVSVRLQRAGLRHCTNECMAFAQEQISGRNT